MPDTLSSNEASPEAKDIVLRLRDTLRCEEAWAIAQTFIDELKQAWEAECSCRK